MKRTLLGMAEAGEPLLRQALDAIRAHNEAQASARPAAEIERLLLEADHLYLTVIMNRPWFPRHSPSSGNSVSHTLLETAA
ncbi:hypothetical protein [Pseudomonas putida]|uniref:hypothetical protein n=1 Tax=Pseudomonas putida TaxID=303 RepID=UPI000A122918|nr:hypothetical protein [Pseudomonas putida]ORL53297.1 hypothetical protein B7H18_02590 [Pseudomonas putida]